MSGCQSFRLSASQLVGFSVCQPVNLSGSQLAGPIPPFPPFPPVKSLPTRPFPIRGIREIRGQFRPALRLVSAHPSIRVLNPCQFVKFVSLPHFSLRLAVSHPHS